VGAGLQNYLGRDKEALENFKQAGKLCAESGNGFLLGRVLTNIAITQQNLMKYEDAYAASELGLEILEGLSEKNILWKAYSTLASIEVNLKQYESAVTNYRKSIDDLEALRTRLPKIRPQENRNAYFMQDKLFVYNSFMALLYSEHQKYPDKGYDKESFIVFEHKQARVFLEQMGKSVVKRYSGVPDDIITQDKNLEVQVETARKNLTNAYEKGIDATQFRKNLTKAEKELNSFEEKSKFKYPHYYAIKYPKPVELATLQNQVLQADEMMLVYNVMEENTVLWVIGKQNFQMFSLPVDEKTLEEKVAKLRGYLSNPSFDKKIPSASMHLYQTLLPKAVQKLIKDAKILYIVPTGPLYGLPFGSLVTSYEEKREIHYLIEDYAISYLSSASLLKIIRAEESDTQPSEPLLAFADPEYPPCNNVGDDKKGAEETFAQLRTESYLKSAKDGCFKRLAATADEVRKIADLFNADHSKALYLRAKASRSTVFALNNKQKLDNYRYVMFSVHGIIPNKFNQLQQPALVLSNPLTEGYLTMADAFALKLNADFVNLSACNTGCAGDNCSENVRGEGIMGLTRAFMYAGTPRVAVTLWAVNLGSAKDLSVGLFTNLKAKKKMAHALREIKLKMIQGKASDPRYANPYHWAAFVVYGDGQ
jgi:CHAT domain-containing protein